MYVLGLSKYKYNYKKIIFGFLKEVRIFLTFFLIVFLGMVVFTNADMFWEIFFANEIHVENISEKNAIEQTKVNIHNSAFGNLDEEYGTNKEDGLVLKVIDESIKNYKNINFSVEATDFIGSEEYLKEIRKDQLFDFNVLPPTDRIVIPSVGVDVPVVDSKVNNILNFTHKDFDSELMSGVVKYPTTPVPGINGNTLLFGHTSQERWKNNNYSTVFNKLPKLKKGDIISVVWRGKLYNYQMVDKKIVYPKGVEGVYQEYQKADSDYLTLMGCYPLGSDRKRILVIAKRV